MERYGLGGYQYPDPVVAEIRTRRRTEGDDESTIGWKAYFRLERSREGTSVWEVGLGYDQTFGDDFDHSEDVSIDRSTAYKFRPRERQLTKFKLARYYLGRQPKAKLELAYADILHLNKLYTYLDEKTACIEDWVESGLAMTVLCRSGRCRRGSVHVSNQVLSGYADKGLLLADLKTRFRCRECGHRDTLMFPTQAP